MNLISAIDLVHVHYGDCSHNKSEKVQVQGNVIHDRFPVAFERFQRWHRTQWRDYLLDNKRSSMEKVWKCRVHVHFCRRSEDDQAAAGEGLL